MLTPFLDKLRQQSNTEEAVQIVSVSGGVKNPGEYPLDKKRNLF